ncbi:MAG TPA: hypothetical protein VGF94_24125 [Kofleriaceae bacterium]|jgi:hypothetical protein
MSRLALAVLVALAACRSDADSNAPTVTVHVLAGTAGEADATVISYSPTGELIDEELADPTGDAFVATTDGALISVFYPGDPSTATAQIQVVTTEAPAAGGDITIFGPPDPPSGPPTVVGVLQVEPVQPITADSYAIELGCYTFTETTLVNPIDLAAACVGTDLNVNALVLATSAGTLAGYAATRLPLGDGGVVFAPAQWDTTTGSIPITLDDGVAPALDWVLYSDGLPFAAQPIAGTAPVWNGLVVDGAEVHANVTAGALSQVTTRELAGAPAAIEFGAADFLPPLAASLALDTSRSLALTWTASAIGADAIDAHLTWTTGTTTVVWDAVLPPDATGVGFPPADSALAALVVPPAATPSARLRYIDSPAAQSFADVLAAGIQADASTAPPVVVAKPATGEVRETDATGFASP